MNKVILDNSIWKLDVSVVEAYLHMIETQWDFNIFSAVRDSIIRCTVDDIFNYFMETYNPEYRVFYGRTVYMHTSKFSIRFSGELLNSNSHNSKYDDTIIFSGEYETVQKVIRKFDEDFKGRVIPRSHMVSMVINGASRLEHINLPVKSDRTFYPELYPIINDPNQFIDDFLNSTANVLIFTGPAGLGKSAFINEIILKANVPTQIVFDKEVMQQDRLYTDFISRTLSDNGGLMIMEDADIILSDRTVSQNEMMSRLLNLSDGIVNTAGAKFIFTANLKNKNDIDEALIRPGRCFDVVEFRNLTYKEALTAADAIGVELFDHEKNEYTVAEIFNKTANRKEKRKFGFV